MTGRRITFTREGVRVEEEREAPLSDETRVVTLDELTWDEFPIENLTMEIENIEPILSEYDEKALTGLKFEVSSLDRTGQPRDESMEDFWTQVSSRTGIEKEGDEISLAGDKSAKANLVHFVDFLLDNEYMTYNDLPIESGWKRYLINTIPEHKDGEPMSQSVEIDNGVFIETKYSRDAIKKKIAELANKFGGKA